MNVAIYGKVLKISALSFENINEKFEDAESFHSVNLKFLDSIIVTHSLDSWRIFHLREKHESIFRYLDDNFDDYSDIIDDEKNVKDDVTGKMTTTSIELKFGESLKM